MSTEEIEVTYDPLPPRSVRLDWVAEARAASERGDDNHAIAAAREALALDGRNAEVWTIRARSSFALEHFQDAEFEAREAVRLAPQVGVTHEVLAGVYEVQERFADALREINEAIRLEPMQYRFQATVGSIYVGRGTPAEAIPIFERLTHAVPGEPTYRRALAEALDCAAVKTWTQLPDGDRIITSAEQVKVTRDNASRGLALEFNDDELRRELKMSLAAADRAESKRWRLPNRVSAGLYGALFGILFLFGLAGMASGATGAAVFGFFLLLLAAGEVWLYVTRHRQPVWQLDAATARRLTRGAR